MSKPITDLELYAFLQALLADQRGDNPAILTGWEKDFLNDYSYAERQSIWLTDGRRRAVDRMWRKYGGLINLPHPVDAVPEPKAVGPVSHDTCEVWVKDA